MSQQPQLSVNEAAQTLGRSTEQVRRYLREGRLQGTRVGGQWFIDSAQLEVFGQALHEPKSFLQQLPLAAERDPLGGVIAIGGGGGKSNMSRGKVAYREAFRWRRTS